MSVASSGAVRVALLFGSAAVAVAILLTPIAEKASHRTLQANTPFSQIDPIATGTIASPNRTFTVRRSVLNQEASDLCIIQSNGTRIGSC